MGFWTKLEKMSEHYIEGLFKQKFDGAVQPADIAKLISREMRDNKTVSISKIYIPNEYTVFVADHDWDQLSSMAGSLSAELQDFVKAKAEQRKYAMVGPARVLFEQKGGLSAGTLEVKGRFSEVLPGDAQKQQVKPEPIQTEQFNQTIIAQRQEFFDQTNQRVAQDTLVNKDLTILATLQVRTDSYSERTYTLGTKTVVIGRRRSSEIPLLDENVSRSHAEISYADQGHTITDLGSTNGVYVNGTRVLKKKLVDGDEIKVGGTVIQYKVV